MREIKLRAYLGGVMHPVWVRIDDDVYTTHPDIRIMQFTGLTDKNGKEIYEGDVMRNLHGDIDVIEWSTNFAGWYFKEFSTGFGKLRIEDWQWEVIDNIYENPELIDKIKEVE